MLGVSDQGGKAAAQFRTLDMLELLFQIDPAVPDLERRKIREKDDNFPHLVTGGEPRIADKPPTIFHISPRTIAMRFTHLGGSSRA